MSDERPCKRPRTEDTPAEAVPTGSCTDTQPANAATATTKRFKPKTYKRDADIWFPTGNVIVVANFEIEFRVHRGVLTNRSEVLRDLFALPSSDTIPGGHSEIFLFDSPEDVKTLLLVLCCRKNYFYHRDEPIPVAFNTLSSLIRMAHKYCIQDLYDTAMARLQKYYTPDFRTWDDVKTRKSYVKAEPQDAIEVIKLARLTETPSLLPSAFFICCSLNQIRDVHTRDGEPIPWLVELPAWDQERVLTGKTKLARICATRVFDLMQVVPCETCRTPERCGMAVQRNLKRIPRSDFERGINDQNALAPLNGWFWTRGQAERPCGRCTAASDELHKQMRLETWRRLPEIFQIVVKDWAKEPEPEPEAAEEDGEEEAEEEDT